MTLEFMENRITELVGLDQERKLVPNLRDIGLRRPCIDKLGARGIRYPELPFRRSEYIAREM